MFLRFLKNTPRAVLSLLTSRPSLKCFCRSLFIYPAADHIPTYTTAEIINEFQTARTRTQNIELPKVVPRRMEDSFVTAIVPLAKSSALRSRYVTFYGSVRVGRLLEDLDILAAWSCFNHIKPDGGGQPPFFLVTALVDRVNFPGDLMNANKDIRLAAHVSWVGKSSMEVAVLVDQRNAKEEWNTFTSAKFVFVARNISNTGPVLVNPLIGDTADEVAFIQRGEERSRHRKRAVQDSLDIKAPTEEERELIHKLFVSTLDKSYGGFRSTNSRRLIQPSNTRYMEENRLNTLMLCHPQHQNIHGKIFGGLIMRKAFELAFSNAYLYSKSLPSVISIDDIIFRKPVEVGAILRFGSEVAYVEGDFLHVPVTAEVLNAETGQCDVTNIFHFTFLARSDKSIPAVLPNTYSEAMIYLNARRHFKHMQQCYLLNTSN